ncbi:DeoR family transcriptional regulator [Streptomyces microflavus]|uniref:DeoR family transcriptional regulator n=1 Tax=Streptomyces microflavus TaxID=1919 RepID=UPI00365FA750
MTAREATQKGATVPGAGEASEDADHNRRELKTERQLRILEYVSKHGGADVTALATWLKVSGATVRRDLQ